MFFVFFYFLFDINSSFNSFKLWRETKKRKKHTYMHTKSYLLFEIGQKCYFQMQLCRMQLNTITNEIVKSVLFNLYCEKEFTSWKAKNAQLKRNLYLLNVHETSVNIFWLDDPFSLCFLETI